MTKHSGLSSSRPHPEHGEVLGDPCPHGSFPVVCEKCDPVPIAIALLRKLMKASSGRLHVRGHSAECMAGGTCYCGALGDISKAYIELSWAIHNAESWITAQSRKIAEASHDYP